MWRLIVDIEMGRRIRVHQARAPDDLRPYIDARLSAVLQHMVDAGAENVEIVSDLDGSAYRVTIAQHRKGTGKWLKRGHRS